MGHVLAVISIAAASVAASVLMGTSEAAGLFGAIIGVGCYLAARVSK